MDDMLFVPKPHAALLADGITLNGSSHKPAPARVDGHADDAPVPVTDAAPRAGSAPDGPAVADGWREAIAALTAERDRLRSEVAVERCARQAAEQRADEAERGRHAAERRLEQMRTALWRWFAGLSARPWWRRLRGLPPLPDELVAGPLLEAPED